MAAAINDRFARLLHKGHNGDRVALLQGILDRSGKAGFKVSIDGVFGNQTAKALANFQKAASVHATGILDRATARLLEAPADLLFAGSEREIFPGATGPFPVRGDTGMKSVFGDPFIAGWDEEYLVKINLPGKILKGDGDRSIWVHRYAKARYLAAFSEMVDAGLKFGTYDGTLCKRFKRGGNTLSVHSWAAASDFDAAKNGMGAKPTMSPAIVSIWEAAGFLWGGRWRSPDGMHFQVVSGI